MAAVVGVILTVVAGLGLAVGGGGPVAVRGDQAIVAPGGHVEQAPAMTGSQQSVIRVSGTIQQVNGTAVKVGGVWVGLTVNTNNPRLLRVGLVVEIDAAKVGDRLVAQRIRVVSIGPGASNGPATR